MSELTLEDMLRLAHEQAERVLIGEGPKAQLVPTWLIDGATRMLLATPWADDRQKDLTCRAIGATMREKGTLRYSFLSEAWVSMRPAGAMPPEEAAKKVFTDSEMPRNDPNRREVVMTIAADKDRAIQALYTIIRGEGGGVVRLDHDKTVIATPFRGRFANLLKGSDADD